jgi:hypothetical protein
VHGLEREIQLAREAAQQPSKDLELVTIIEATNRNFHDRYKQEHKQLEEILAKQIRVLEVVEKQSIAASTLLQMASAMADSIQHLAQSSDDVVAGLKRVAAQQTLTVAELLDIWKSARRRNAKQHKTLILANTPCTGPPGAASSTQIAKYAFTTTSNDTVDYSLKVRFYCKSGAHHVGSLASVLATWQHVRNPHPVNNHQANVSTIAVKHWIPCRCGRERLEQPTTSWGACSCTRPVHGSKRACRTGSAICHQSATKPPRLTHMAWIL